MVAEVNAGSPPLILKDSKIIDWLIKLPKQFTLEESKTLWRELDLFQEVFDAFFSLLLRKKVVIDAPSVKGEEWSAFGWQEAHAFHEATRDYPFLDMGKPSGFVDDESRMEDFKSASLPPPIYQKFDAKIKYPLEKVESFTGLDELIENSFEKGKTTLKHFSVLFDLCFGERKKVDFGIQGHFLQKAIPSGGARHTTEVFFVYFNNAAMENGIYHYNVEENSLDQLKKGNYFEEFFDATLDLFTKYTKRPFGLVIFTCLHERAMWRYRDSRSWRAPMIDIGHAMMILRTVSQKLGFDYYSYQKFKDKEVSELLELDNIRQTPLYVTTLV
ncbi:MAG: SagB/ThcOx family dehydrogenase [Alphaproteobacteria bacterium]|jgi:SagB-type dehydrogenase family enzyme|nr:SagB/ThcOx family dehydrogenase [Alphaproteobacteria bacterium]